MTTWLVLALALELAARPTTIHTGIGSAHDGASTSSKEAQAFYDQGLAYLHSYVWLEAARSFNQALALDPKLALAHAGLVVAYTELNAPAASKAALDRAKALAATDHDKRHVAARALQAEGKTVEYRQALDEALKTFPLDEELWLARGQAASDDPAERGQGSVAASIPFYEKARTYGLDEFLEIKYLCMGGIT